MGLTSEIEDHTFERMALFAQRYGGQLLLERHGSHAQDDNYNAKLGSYKSHDLPDIK